MTTSLQLLPAINSLYSLGLSSKDIRNLAQKIDEIVTEEDATVLSKTLSYSLRADNVLISSFPSLHTSELSQITIKKFGEDDEDQLASPSVLDDKESGFTINLGRYMESNYLTIKAISKKSKETLTALVTFLDSVLGIDTRDDTFWNKFCGKYETVESAREALTEIIENDVEQFNNISRKKLPKLELVRAVLGHIFPSAKHTTIDEIDSGLRQQLEKSENLSVITDVWEFNNSRLFIDKSKVNRTYARDDWNARLTLIQHTHRDYDYVDVGRIAGHKDNSYGYYSNLEQRSPERVVGDVLFVEDNPVIPVQDVLDDYFRTFHEDESVRLSNKDLQLIAKRYDQRKRREADEEKQKEIIATKVKTKLDTLLDKTKTLKLNDMIFSHNQITYQGQILFLDTENWVSQLMSQLVSLWDLNDINFDIVLEKFLDIVETYRGSGKIGDVFFTITSRDSTNVNNVTSTRFFINDVRVNKKEIRPCIERGLCYTEQDDFEYFLKSVSACSLEMHRYLQTGIDCMLRDQFDNTQIAVKFPLQRRKNINYLVLGDEEYRISNTKKLIGLQRKYNLLDVINALLSNTVVQGVQPEDIKSLITSAKQAYVDAVEKSKQLLEETEELFGIKMDNYTLQDGDQKRGYRIKGKIRQYLLEVDEDNVEDGRHGVYEYPSGRYICIVDKSTAQVGLDRVVNRIFALHNDSVLAGQITTL